MEFLFKKLTENIKSHSNIVIMTHKNPDLDGMGSAIGLSKIVESFKKECYVVIPDYEVNISLKKGLHILSDNNIKVNFKTVSEVLDLINDNSLLIILDTQKTFLVESSDILENVKDICVIDHHEISSGKIENPLFEYINPGKSSTVEIITGYLKYLNKEIDAIIATIMSAGMEIDTHAFSVNTTEDTFRAASFLLKMGTDLVLKKDILKETMDDAIERYEYIKKSYYICDGYVVCDMGDKITEVSKLAILANELLTFDGVIVSFVVGKVSDNDYHVSARSTGKVNVEEIMKELGGGGHLTDAAAQFTDTTGMEIIDRLKSVVMEG